LAKGQDLKLETLSTPFDAFHLLRTGGWDAEEKQNPAHNSKPFDRLRAGLKLQTSNIPALDSG
jgi:hypothetical protein